MVERAEQQEWETAGHIVQRQEADKDGCWLPFSLLFIWSRTLTHRTAQDTSRVNLPSLVFLVNTPKTQCGVSLLGELITKSKFGTP